MTGNKLTTDLLEKSCHGQKNYQKSIQKQKGIEICSFCATIKQTGHFLHYEGLLLVFYSMIIN